MQEGGGPSPPERVTMSNVMPVQPGDFLAEPLVTDTLVYEVIRVSPHGKSIWVRRTIDNGQSKRDLNVDQGPYPVVWNGQQPNPDGEIKRLGRRKDGSYRMYQGGSKLRPAPFVDGNPVRRVDYRY